MLEKTYILWLWQGVSYKYQLSPVGLSCAYLLYLTAFVFIYSVNYYQLLYQFVLKLLQKVMSKSLNSYCGFVYFSL